VRVQSSTIENRYLRIKSINIGACLYEVYDKQKKINLILNLGSTKNYGSKNFYVGATCGRYAGRISNSRFKIKNKIYKLDGNEGKNTLHGGKIGFDRLEWKIQNHSKTKIIYQLLSKNLDQGFPGDLNSECIFEIKDKSLFIKYQYKSNQLTHVSLTNHSYWNLNKNKNETIFNHDLKINSEKYLEVTNKLIPTSKIKNVENTINDFNKFQNIGEKINIIKNKKIKKISNTINQLGFDLTYCIKKNSKNYLASLKNKKTNIQLDFYSNLPGVQLYTSQGLRYKNKLAPYQGVCLETQHYPDAPNKKKFPSTLIKPNKLYKYFTKINIS
jgi:aldose 1-epimerase